MTNLQEQKTGGDLMWCSPLINNGGGWGGVRLVLHGIEPPWVRWQLSGLGDVFLSGSELAIDLWVRTRSIPDWVILEIPEWWLSNPIFLQKIIQWAGMRKPRIAIYGKPRENVNIPSLLGACCTIIPWREDRRRFDGEGVIKNFKRQVGHRTTPFFNCGVDNWYDVKQSLCLGSSGVFANPWGSNDPFGVLSVKRDVIFKLLDLTRDGCDSKKMAETIRKDPALALRFVRSHNSLFHPKKDFPFSFESAFPMIERQKLIEWLERLLPFASEEVSQKFHWQRAWQRSLFLKKIDSHVNGDYGDILFLAGALSLVEKLGGWGENNLRDAGSFPEEILAAIFRQQGIYGEYWKLLKMMEQDQEVPDWSALALRLKIMPDKVCEYYVASLVESFHHSNR